MRAVALPVIPGYHGLRPLGRGGSSLVYAARADDGREVALKLLRPGWAARAAREAAALTRVGPTDAPALVEHGQAAGRRFLALERLRGRTLAATLARARGGRVDDARARAWLGDACARVARVHAAGVVHRDLKPANLFLRADGGLVLLDFGLARFVDEAGEPALATPLTRAGERPGTPAYMAPELCRGEGGDARSDVYALGVLAFALYTGRLPFVGDAAAVLQQQVAFRAPRPSRFAAVPDGLDAVVARCLAKEPEARFAGAAELGAALSALPATLSMPMAASLPVATTPATTAARPMALVGVRHHGPLPAITAVAPAATVAAVAPGLCVLAFADVPTLAAGVAAAHAAADALVAAGAVATVQVAPLVTHQTRRGRVLLGDALAAPNLWIDREIDRAAEPASDSAGDSSGDAVALVGRAALIAELHARVTATLEARTPLLATLTGVSGSGRTRLLGALATALPSRVLRLDAAAGAGQGHAAARALWQLLPGAGTPPPSRAALAGALAERLRAAAPLVLLVDDAERADQACLDALEQATAEAGAALAVIAAATPALATTRPAWGERAAATLARPLAPLDDADARALVTALLHPVEYVPERALLGLVASGGGLPGHLVALVRALARAGALRRHPGRAGWYLASDELASASTTPLGERLAARALQPLTPALRAAAELVAVAGAPLPRAELAALVATAEVEAEADGADAEGPLAGGLDAGVLVARLAACGLVRIDGDGAVACADALLGAGVAALIPPARRRALGALYCRVYADDTSPAGRARFAEHAAAAGQPEAAARAHLDLGEAARLGHDEVAAEQRYSAALALGCDPALRGAALAGRGRVRYRAQRLDEALADLEAAFDLAAGRGDAAELAALDLDIATVLDWRNDYAGAAARTEAAAAHLAHDDDAGLAARLLLGRGRAAYRRERFDAALPLLEAAAEGAAAAGDADTETIARLLAAATLGFLDRPEDAARAYDALIARCQASGDLLHLATAHGNRTALWLQQHDHARAAADLARAMQLGRRLGNARIEAYTAANLALLSYWCGDADGALPIAERARQLTRRFQATPFAEDALLVARIQALRGEAAAARAEVEWITRACAADSFGPAVRLFLTMLRLDGNDAPDDDADGWHALLLEAGGCQLIADERLELHYFAARAAARHGRGGDAAAFAAAARTIVNGAAAWAARFAALAPLSVGDASWS